MNNCKNVLKFRDSIVALEYLVRLSLFIDALLFIVIKMY